MSNNEHEKNILTIIQNITYINNTFKNFLRLNGDSTRYLIAFVCKLKRTMYVRYIKYYKNCSIFSNLSLG